MRSRRVPVRQPTADIGPPLSLPSGRMVTSYNLFPCIRANNQTPVAGADTLDLPCFPAR